MTKCPPKECFLLGACSSDNAFGRKSEPVSVTHHRGMVEFFSGSGHLSTACTAKGIEVAASIDIRHGPHHDLTRRSTQEFLCRLILQANLFYCHFGTPCAVFSSARKGIKNFVTAHFKERVSCELAFLTAKLCEACMQVGTFWSIENPSTLALWDFFPIRNLMNRADTFIVEFPMCAYGTPYRKYTRILTNLVGLCSLQRECHHVRHAVQPSGQTKTWDGEKWVSKNRTQLAGAYPQQLAETWASLLKRACPKNAEKEYSTDFGRIEAELKQAAEKRPVQHQWFLQNISKQIPTLQQHIIYGQDSAVLKHQKRQRREKAKSKLQKAWDSAAKALTGFEHLNQSSST